MFKLDESWIINKYTNAEILKLSDGVSISILKLDGGFDINIMGKKEFYKNDLLPNISEAKKFALRKLKEKLNDVLEKIKG